MQTALLFSYKTLRFGKFFSQRQKNFKIVCTHHSKTGKKNKNDSLTFLDPIFDFVRLYYQHLDVSPE